MKKSRQIESCQKIMRKVLFCSLEFHNENLSYLIFHNFLYLHKFQISICHVLRSTFFSLQCRVISIEYNREDIFEFSYLQNKKWGIRMMKYLYVAITIMTDDVLVLWRGREGIFALSRMLI